jgi:hypothetical protein
MPRTLSGTIESEVALPITQPGYLVFLGFTPELRYATRETIVYNGYTWSAGFGVGVSSVTDDAAVITLRNHDNSASALVLNHTLANVLCEVYMEYGDDAVLLFSGTLDSAQVGTRVTLKARGMVTSKKAPNAYIAYPIFNHLFPAGTKIQWGLDTLVLE